MALRKVNQTAAPAQTASAVPQGMGPNLMNPKTFVPGGGIPAGDYVVFFEVKNHQPTDKATGNTKGDLKLGIMLSAFAINDVNAEPKTQHYSIGRNAHKAYMPNADGSGIVPIPGAPPQSLYHDTAWDLFINEAVNAGLPETLTSPKQLNGAWVHIEQVDEPASWAAMAAQTGATAEIQGKPREKGKISVISTFLAGGKPWEGGGGLDKIKAGARPTAAAGAVAVAAPVAQAAAAAVVVEESGDEAEMLEAADEACKSVLEMAGNENGCSRAVLRNQANEYLKKSYGEETADKIFAYVFDTPEKLGIVLAESGFEVKGLKVVPMGK